MADFSIQKNKTTHDWHDVYLEDFLIFFMQAWCCCRICHFTYCWTHYEHCGRRLTQQQIVFTRTTSRTLLLWVAQQISAASRDRETIGHKAKYESFDWALCCEQSVDRPLMAMFVGLDPRARTTFFGKMWTSCLCHWNLSHLSLKRVPYNIWLEEPDVMWYLRCFSAPCPTQYDQKKGSCGASEEWGSTIMDALGGASTTCQQKQRVDDKWLTYISPTGRFRCLLSTGG